MANSPSLLMSLPSELLEHTSSYLDLPSLRACRIVNNELKAHVLRQFQSYFTSVHTSLDPLALDELIEITKHEEFGPIVQHVGVNLIRHRNNPNDSHDIALKLMLDQCDSTLPWLSQASFKRYSAALKSGVSANLLAFALKQAKNVNEVSLYTLEREFCYIDYQYNGSLETISQLALSAVLLAIISSGVKLQKLGFDRAEWSEDDIGSTNETFELTKLPRKPLRQAFENISSLRLYISSYANMISNVQAFVEFLELTPALKEFTLRLGWPLRYWHYLLESMFERTNLPYLRVFDVQLTDCDGYLRCLEFLRRHSANLEGVHLHNLCDQLNLSSGRITSVYLPLLTAIRDELRLVEFSFTYEFEWFGSREWEYYSEVLAEIRHLHVYGGNEKVKKKLTAAIGRLQSTSA